ncbi:MAG: ferrochelatase [Pseudomonadota bacterium]
MSKKKVAVVLFNLGGPDTRSAIKPFLMNFFMDKNIIQLPIPFRCFLAALIAKKRSKREAGDSYEELGGRSPLLENSQAQGQALENLLNKSGDSEFKSFICMRYWHPMASQVVREVRDWKPDHIVLLPLYPQFSTTTTNSSLEQWHKAADIAELNTPTATICCYPWEKGFIQGSADNVKTIYEKAKSETGKTPRVLFSAHGLPEKIIKQGDPYQWQCEQSAEKIAQATGIDNLDWQICYQSRVGPLKWIGPSTEEALEKAAEDKVPVVILPHAFTQEHVETLVEIEIEYREEAEKMGLHDFYRVPTVGAHDHYIQGLADMVLARTSDTDTKPDTQERLCDKHWSKCCMSMDYSARPKAS